MPLLILIACVAAVAGLVLLWAAWKRRRRRILMQKPFPVEWRRLLKNRVYLYRHLPEGLKDQLHGLIHVFLDEKRFVGCGGFVVTEEVRVTVAAEACMLLLNRKTPVYPRLVTVCIYPDAYVASRVESLGPLVTETDSVRAGESWDRGTLVLSWRHVAHGMQDPTDGHNVVVHEFAHQLDVMDGRADGAPVLPERSMYRDWARVLSHEFEKLKDDAARHRRNVLDPYGATNPAEFFAVATETFFGKPKALKNKEPELYEELKAFYRLDPVEWIR